MRCNDCREANLVDDLLLLGDALRDDSVTDGQQLEKLTDGLSIVSPLPAAVHQFAAQHHIIDGWTGLYFKRRHLYHHGLT